MAFDSKIFWKKTAARNRAMNKYKNILRELAGKNLQKYTEGYSDELLANLRTTTKRTDGEIDTIKLAVLRYGIIREVGAGRGWPGGRRETSNSQKPRTPAPWLEESFSAVSPPLADALSKISGDELVAHLDAQLIRPGNDRYTIS